MRGWRSAAIVIAAVAACAAASVTQPAEACGSEAGLSFIKSAKVIKDGQNFEIHVHRALGTVFTFERDGFELVRHPSIARLAKFCQESGNMTMQRVDSLNFYASWHGGCVSDVFLRSFGSESAQLAADLRTFLRDVSKKGRFTLQSGQPYQSTLETFSRISNGEEALRQFPTRIDQDTTADFHRDGPTRARLWIPFHEVHNFPLTVYRHGNGTFLHQPETEDYWKTVMQDTDNWFAFLSMSPGQAVLFDPLSVPHGLLDLNGRRGPRMVQLIDTL